jgi:hypothetical protein
MSPGPGASGYCVYHPEIEAAILCQSCGNPICLNCEFQLPNGNLICPDCANAPPMIAASAPPIYAPAPQPEPAYAAPPPPAAAAYPPAPISPLRMAPSYYAPPPPRAPPQIATLKGLNCLQHPEIGAVQICQVCAAPMCATCEFVLPGDAHVCPRCVLAPPQRMSGGRKTMLMFSYGLAVMSTLGIGLLFSGALAEGSREDRIIAALVGILIFIPTVIGTALSIAVFDRRLPNPGSLWGAAIWNGLLMLIMIFLVIIGNLSS